VREQARERRFIYRLCHGQFSADAAVVKATVDRDVWFRKSATNDYVLKFAADGSKAALVRDVRRSPENVRCDAHKY